MTAVNIAVRPDRVFVIADGAGLDPEGRLVHRVMKITCLPHQNAVIAIRGTWDQSVGLPIAIGLMASSYDDLKVNIASKTRLYFEKVIANFPSTPTCFVADIFIAGWSDGLGRADAYLVTTHDQHAGIAPWSVVDLPYGILTPPIGDGWDAAIRDHAELMSLMPAILGVQRKALDAGRPGGFVQVATVSRRSITTRIIGMWPADRHGAALDPDASFEEWQGAIDAQP